MKSIVMAVATALFSSVVVAAAEVAPCSLTDPWQVMRAVSVGEKEYNLVVPFEVEIFVGSGSSVCMLNPGPGISLVSPIGFSPEKENTGVPPSKMSWVKVGNTSFPIMSKYKLAVAPVQPGPVIFVPPTSTPEIKQQQPLLQDEDIPQHKMESSCGFWCKTALVVTTGVIIGLAVRKKSSTPATTPAPGGPVNPAP